VTPGASRGVANLGAMTTPETQRLFANGRTARVILDGNLLTITPTVLAKAAGRRGQVQVRADQLAGVQYSPAHLGTLGFLRFVSAGSPAMLDRRAAEKDPYTVLFARGARRDFEALRDAVMARIRRA